MARVRRPEIPLPVRRTDDAPRVTLRQLLLETWAGRLFLIAVGLKLLVLLWRAALPVPAILAVLSGAATLAIIVALVLFGWRLFVLVKRRLLWRVRRKLILSYIFIGVVPSLLILVFFLFAGNLVFMNVSAYLFKDGYDQIMDDARLARRRRRRKSRATRRRHRRRCSASTGSGSATIRRSRSHSCRARARRLPRAHGNACRRRRPSRRGSAAMKCSWERSA
jgi:hypothetical protein